MLIDAAFSKLVFHANLRAANNARLTTAVADLCHANNVPDRLVGTPQFKEVIDAAKMVDADYKLPDQKVIGGYLLKENVAAYIKGNFGEVTKDGPKFVYIIKGDNATMIKRPLLNVFVMNGN